MAVFAVQTFAGVALVSAGAAIFVILGKIWAFSVTFGRVIAVGALALSIDALDAFVSIADGATGATVVVVIVEILAFTAAELLRVWTGRTVLLVAVLVIPRGRTLLLMEVLIPHGLAGLDTLLVRAVVREALTLGILPAEITACITARH